MIRPTLFLAVLAGAILFAPQAHADHAEWDRPIEPGLGPSPMMSINYAMQATYGPYPEGVTGMWQVFATPPGIRVIPGPQHFCGYVPYQGAPAPNCPAGWDLWYR